MTGIISWISETTYKAISFSVHPIFFCLTLKIVVSVQQRFLCNTKWPWVFLQPQHFTFKLMAFHFPLNWREVTAGLAKALTAAFSKDTQPARPPRSASHTNSGEMSLLESSLCNSRTSVKVPLLTELSSHQRDSLASFIAFGGTGKSSQQTKDLETRCTEPNPAAKALLYQYSSPWNPSKIMVGLEFPESQPQICKFDRGTNALSNQTPSCLSFFLLPKAKGWKCMNS